MEKKPEWLKVRYNQDAVNEVAALMRDLKLNTVCKEANCPNLGECYQKHTSTFMILGSVCTRNCRFCNVTTGHPLPPRPGGAHERGKSRQKAESAARGADLLHP
jgi:lipoic acid synthetase